MISFCRTHKVALLAEFVVVAISLVALYVADHYWLKFEAEQFGMTLLFGALPWSYMTKVGSGIYNFVIITVGIGFNVVIITSIVGSVISRWFKVVRQ